MAIEAEAFPGTPNVAPWEASTQNDPELAGHLTEQALATPPPEVEIETPPSNVVELPGGYIDGLGQIHRHVVVRELTGRDEEAISRLDPVKSPSALIRAVTKFGVVELAGGPPTDVQLGMLLVGDRNAVVLGIRRVTFGNHLPVEIVCPSCKAREEVTVELDKDIPIKQMTDPMARVFDVEISRGVAKVALTTAEIEDQMLDMTKATTSEVNTHMLRRCVFELNGQPPSNDTLLDLSIADRRKLIDAIIDGQPGPQYSEVSLPCGTCGREFPLTLSLGDLFRY